MQSGSFLSANSEATGVLRLLSLLNLSGLFRRANMNQLFDPGVTFDRAAGRFEFDKGLMRIPDFSIEGSGGYFNFTSDVDLLNETLNGELVVTLPLVENIPWVAHWRGDYLLRRARTWSARFLRTKSINCRVVFTV